MYLRNKKIDISIYVNLYKVQHIIQAVLNKINISGKFLKLQNKVHYPIHFAKHPSRRAN